MPNLHTHVIFARDVQDRLTPSLKSIIEKNQRLFLMGANGPDFCFFHGYLPTQFDRHSLVRKLGKKVHRQSINQTYDTWARMQPTDAQMAFLLGHLCHWALDSLVHPMVYYRCGSKGTKASIAHHTLESLWDAMCLKVFWKTDVSKVHMYRSYQLNEEEVKAVAKLYVPIAQAIYNLSIEEKQIGQAIQGAYQIQKLLHDPSDRKRKMIRKLENLAKQTGALTGLIVPKAFNDPCDIANLMHEQWCYPAEPTITSTDSFFDLYDKALERAKQVLTLFVESTHSGNTASLLQFIADQSYIKGTATKDKMRVFDPNLEENRAKLIAE